MNLTNFSAIPFEELYQAVSREAERLTTHVASSELIGFVPRRAFEMAPEFFTRAENFDPQTDPIVRVEAMRLRRALGRYYANGGQRYPVLINLPLGSYVPAFRHNVAVAPEPCQEPAPAALPPTAAMLSPPAAPSASAAAPGRLRSLAAADPQGP